MPKNYEEAYSLFTEFLNRQLSSVQSKLKNADYYSSVQEVYESIKEKDYSRFIEHYDVLYKISADIRDNLEIIKFLVSNNITKAPQLDEAMDKVLQDKSLLKIVSNKESKDMLEGKKEKIESVLNGTCDFESFKNALLDSDLSDEVIICILTHEAKKSIEHSKKSLPSLDQSNKENGNLLKKNKEIVDKCNSLIEKYYHLVMEKPANIIEMYKKTLNASNISDINRIYQEKDVRVCLNILNLINIKTEGEEILNTKPVDYSLLEINTEDLNEAYKMTLDSVIDYEKMKQESMIVDASVYYLLKGDKPLFEIDEYNEDEKKLIESILSDLENGLFDYERGKPFHTVVKQVIRKDLNVFVNRKRNMAVSFLRINSEELKESKVLVLSVNNAKNIFDSSISILRNNSPLIDESISKIKNGEEEFLEKQDDFKSSIKRGEVPQK